jgi:FMN-dependent oxidoreductase (nitrilotriacetate monooxygenase family)
MEDATMTTTSKKQVRLSFSPTVYGQHHFAWRLPESTRLGLFEPRRLLELARTVERGKFDHFFCGSQLGGDQEWELYNYRGGFFPHSITMAAQVAAVTEQVGLVATLNTNALVPYDAAHAIGTLDHFSGGRAGINLITSRESEVNFRPGRLVGGDEYDAEQRTANGPVYDRVEEIIEALNALWDSWEPDAIVADKATGQWLDASKGRPIHLDGEYFSIRGPLNLPALPQGRPPIVIAGTSDRNKEIGARHAHVRFAPYVDTAWNRAYYADLKERLAKYGRSADEHHIFCGLTIYVAETSREAHEFFRRVQELGTWEYSAEAVSQQLGRDLRGIDPDTRVVDAVDLDSYDATIDLGVWGVFSTARRSTIEAVIKAYGHEDVTLRQVFAALSDGIYPQLPVVGSTEEIADFLEEQIDEEAFDGVNLHAASIASSLDRFVDLVVPELQRRGRHRREYETRTLRGHLGLPPARKTFSGGFGGTDAAISA